MVDFQHKVLIPRQARHFIPRKHLTSLIDAISDQRLLTLTGPAGYGKTSLLVTYAHATDLAVCWYALDTFDQDVWVFLEYLVASLEYRFAGAMQQTRQLLAGYSAVSLGVVTTTLAREIYGIGEDCVIILDDWHVVDHLKEVKDIVEQILLLCPNCHLILASRTYPTLPNMMLLAARRQMHSLDEQHLRFTPEELVAVIEAEALPPLPLERATDLVGQMHGWIAGILLQLQTTTFAMPSGSLESGFAERQIYRFLVEQVFEQQPIELQSFLLDTALLEELSVQHCDTMLQRSDSRRLFDLLLRRHLFVSEIKPGVLRYHTMFSEFLREHYATIAPERYRQIAFQVAEAYAAQGFYQLAFDRYILAGRPDAARTMILRSGEQLYEQGRLETLESWFAQLPAAYLDTPLLCLQARVMIDRGQYQLAQTLVDQAELGAQPEDEAKVLLLKSQLARIHGHYEQALILARRVLEHSPDLAQQAMALRAIGICYDQLSQHEQAIQQFMAALEIERQRSDLYAIARLHHNLGICYKTLGQLQVAEEYYSHADAYWCTLGNNGWRALTLNSKGIVQYLASHYQQALGTLNQALQLAHEAGIPHYQTFVLASLGELFADLQLWERASAFYQEARKLGGTAKALSDLDLAEIQLSIYKGNYAQANTAIRSLSDVTARSYPQKVLLLRSQLAYGQGSYAQALNYLEQAIEAFTPNGPKMDLARAYLIKAVISLDAHPGTTSVAFTALDQSLQLAGQLGHDTFLIIEAMRHREFLRRLATHSWPHAQEWIQRQQELLLTAQGFAQTDQRPTLVVRALGVEELMLAQQKVTISWQRAREVLFYLLNYPNGVTIDVICEAIWPQLDEERKRERLRSAIYQLRIGLPRDLIKLHGRQLYKLNPEVLRIDYDVERFLALSENSADIEDSAPLLEALELYQGPYLGMINSDWCLAMRNTLEQRYSTVLHRVAQIHHARHAYTDALAFYQRIMAIDHFDEAAHAGAMRCYIAMGNRAAAITQYQMLCRLLDEELGLVPAAASEAEQVYRQMLADG